MKENAAASTAATADECTIIRDRASARGKFDYIWLAYGVFFFIEPFVRHNERYWGFCIAIFAFFVVLYIGYQRSESQHLRAAFTLGMFALGIATLPYNHGSIAFFIYAAALIPFTFLPAWIVGAIVSLDALTLTLESVLIHMERFDIGIGIFFTLIVGGTNLFFAQKIRSDSKLRMKQEEIEALAAVAERERIARDLHDVLGHTLSLIVVKAELAGRLLEQQDAEAAARARAEIVDVERTARTALAEVREAIGGYRSRGLAAEIEAARKTLAAAGVELDAHAESVAKARLSASEETVLALALREATTNIVRHAQARTCKLRFHLTAQTRQLIIDDDGTHRDAHEGNGLRGMRERVEGLGGSMMLECSAGTRLIIELPVKDRSSAEAVHA